MIKKFKAVNNNNLNATHNPVFLTYSAYEDLKRYKTLQESDLHSIDEFEKIEIETLSFLEKLGYPIDKKGTYFYKELIVKATRMLLEGHDKNLLLSLLEQPYSQFYFDVARNDHDLGIKSFIGIVEAVESSNKGNNYGDEELSLGKKIFLMASYMAESFDNTQKIEYKQYLKSVN